MKYRGIIIEESLNDNRILNNLNILKLYITEQLDFPIFGL
jgi:hypothetical protein